MNTTETTSIVWFRNDLRASDHPALARAAEAGPVVPVYILDPNDRQLGGASRWWLHHSLSALADSLGGLVVRRGEPLEILQELAGKTGADRIFWNRMYEPLSVRRDTQIKHALSEAGLKAESFRGSVLFEPWELETGTGGPYKVFTPFWKACIARGMTAPIETPRPRLAELAGLGDALSDWGLLPENPNWAEGWKDLWSPGETGARARNAKFLEEGIAGYATLRDRPDLENVSRLSPHLHFGEISPRQAAAAAAHAADSGQAPARDVAKFIAELGWREFSNHLLFHFPEIPDRNWKPTFDNYPWVENESHLRAWQTGMTGYPMVDAGMRELWHTGYMHNRVRMLVASFLVKHLRIHWKEGEAWFWDTLVDADLANNAASWQWVTGSGADAAPYFRIFNPLSQGTKFDPEGAYVRRWCPELADLPNDVIHAPHEADPVTLAAAGVRLGETYPHPIVDHKQARDRALAGYEAVKAAQADAS